MLALSPDLSTLLQSEMREIVGGVQKLAVAIAQGDWEVIQQTSATIQSSYIMAKSLTKEQSEALEMGLPARFRQLDSDFHSRAEKLARAAKTRDFELVSHHYSRLIESCAECHSLYARSRFPGFDAAGGHAHL